MIDQLNKQFGMDGIAVFESGKGGLTRLSITSDQGEAVIYPYGAHVTHFQPRDEKPLLWMSSESLFQKGKAIRGGVPLVFPWFGGKQGDPDAPAHGLVRTAEWSVKAVEPLNDGSIRVSLGLSVDSFDVLYRVSVGRQLHLEMIVTNTSATSITFEQALHTYLAVGDVHQISLTGLSGSTYIDKLDGMLRKVQSDAPIRFVAETDSVYLDTEATVRVEDPTLGRTIVVDKAGSRSTVVWNPWTDKAKTMPDFGDTEWPGMVCIETANIADNAVVLAAGESSTMDATVGIEEKN